MVELPVWVDVDPPLAGPTRRVLDELGGRGGGPRRIWRGQPAGPCRWRVDGRRLVVPGVATAADVDWLAFLLREVLSPRSKGGRARCEALGLTVGHRVRGWFRAEVEGEATWIDVRGGRVRWTGRPRLRDGGPAS